jgi:beta-xylosidase
MKNSVYILFLFLLLSSVGHAQQKTYCNPINIDYGFTPIPDFSAAGRHRATADPVITLFNGDYYLFSTNQWGYWWSSDMYNWHFVPRKFLKPYHKVYDELCAPAVFVLGDTLLVIGSTYTKNFPIWMSTNPKVDDWKEAVDSFRAGAWDPSFFLDDDNRLYLYHGSSNTYPLYGQEVDRHTLQPIGERQDLIKLHDEQHGWERFGEYNDNNFMPPFMEGAWMNKHNGKYYLQYGAPGTEFSGYADGVYVSEHPLGPFTYQAHNPFSYKAGGFARAQDMAPLTRTNMVTGGMFPLWSSTSKTILKEGSVSGRPALIKMISFTVIPPSAIILITCPPKKNKGISPAGCC